MTRLSKIVVVFALVWFVLAMAVGTTSSVSEKSQTVNVLIVTGIDHPDPRMQVRVVEDPHFLDSSALHRYDVVVLHFMNWQKPSPGAKARANLREFVGGGKGLFVVHFGCGAFQDWPEFRKLVGRVWNPKARGHDPRGPFHVNITNAEHPITRGMQSFETDDELYTCVRGERPVELLAT
ncbi:MAG: ThuA domain-containing protein, partial [Planctomycetota bacterium]